MISASTEVVTVEERIKLLQDEIALLHNQVHLHHHLLTPGRMRVLKRALNVVRRYFMSDTGEKR